MQKGDEIRLMNFKINNKTGSPIKFEKEIHSLCDFAKDRLGFKEHPTIFLNHDKRNASNTLGKTGYYDPDTMEIHVFATGRHPKDILRSIAHELVHHNQNERGELNDSGYMGKGYAQKNPHMRKMELQANDPMLFRDWEDSLKEKENTIYNERRNRKMSLKEWKNKEIGDLLTDKWGFKMDLSRLNESAQKKTKDSVLDGCVDRAVKKGMNKSKAESECKKEIKNFEKKHGKKPKSMTLGSTPGENPKFSDLLEDKKDNEKEEEEEKKSEESEEGDNIAARTPPRDKKNKADFLPKAVRDKINAKGKK